MVNAVAYCFNAARSIVCGATAQTGLARPQSQSFNAARSIVCGATGKDRSDGRHADVSMPHAALYVVQQAKKGEYFFGWEVSMPHAALYVVQLSCPFFLRVILPVSMPHAALYVVQPKTEGQLKHSGWFQGRTQHCMWCNYDTFLAFVIGAWFQCRTQHCMWCN